MNTIKYLLRALISIPISAVIAYALNFVALATLYAFLTLIPEIFSEVFSFNTPEVVQDIYYNQLIPGFGSLCALISSPNFSARLMAIAFVVILFIFLSLFAYAVYLLSKLTRNNILAIVLTAIVFFLGYIGTGYLILSGEAYENFGIETGFWFYLSGIIILIILFIINGLSVSYLWEGKNNHR